MKILHCIFQSIYMSIKQTHSIILDNNNYIAYEYAK